jgi:hypothetical protein
LATDGHCRPAWPIIGEKPTIVQIDAPTSSEVDSVPIRFLQRIQRNFFAPLKPRALATPDRDFGGARLSSLSHPSRKFGVSMPKNVATSTLAQDWEKYSRFGKDAETIQRLERVPNARDNYRHQ